MNHHSSSRCKLSFFALEFSRDENEYGYVCIMFYRKCTKLQNTTSPPLLAPSATAQCYHEIQISSWLVYHLKKMVDIFYKSLPYRLYFFDILLCFSFLGNEYK